MTMNPYCGEGDYLDEMEFVVVLRHSYYESYPVVGQGIVVVTAGLVPAA